MNRTKGVRLTAASAVSLFAAIRSDRTDTKAQTASEMTLPRGYVITKRRSMYDTCASTGRFISRTCLLEGGSIDRHEANRSEHTEYIHVNYQYPHRFL